MLIDASKANLTERDIEDWLYQNPGILALSYTDNPITRWMGRQYSLPSGIADLIGIRQDKMLVVVEVKNVAINKAAVLQVCRYADDLKHIVSNRMDYPHKGPNYDPYIEMVLFGPSIDDQTFTEARAVNVRVYQFKLEMNIAASSLTWGHEYYDSLGKQHESIASRPEWEIYGRTILEDIQSRHSEQEQAYTPHIESLPDFSADNEE